MATRRSTSHRHQEARPVLILPRRGMPHHRQDQPHRVDHGVTLAASDLLASVVAPLVPAFGHADRMAVEHSPRRLGVFSRRKAS